MKNVVEIGVDGNKLVERRVNIGEVLKILCLSDGDKM